MQNTSASRSRPRDVEGDSAPEAKARRLESITRLSSDLVDRVASVNGDVIGHLLTRWEQSACEGAAIRARASDMEAMIVKSKGEQVRAEVTTAATTRQLQHHVVLLDAMETKLQMSASRAAETVLQQLDTLMMPSLRRTAAQLEKERDINDALTDRVRQFLANCMETLRLSSQRALSAELQTAERDVAVARLKALLSFEQVRTLRHTQEVETLLSILRALAERTKGAEQTKHDLMRCKEHVRRLERYLDLNGITAAIMVAESEPHQNLVGGSSSDKSSEGQTSALAVSWSGRQPPAPAPELKRSAPHYFALRMLQHRDMTLSDLVDAWQHQESRILAADARYVELQEAAKKLKEDAALVHQQYLEERQRREITDRRLTEMVLERVERDRAVATQTEISRLRANYTKVVDDASHLAVSLQMSRTALEEARDEIAALRAQVKQLETDAAADEVASTVCTLREQYEAKLASVRGDLIDAQTERHIALSMAEARGRDQQRLQEALLLSRENNTEMTTSLVESLKQGPYFSAASIEDAAKHECDESRAALLDMTNRVHSAVEYLETAHKDVTAEREDMLNEFANQLSSLTASFEALSRGPPLPPCTSPEVEFQDADADSSAAGSPSAQLRTWQHEESNKMMKRVVTDALEFVAGHLDATDDQRNHLVDASISDAQYVSFIADRLRRVTADRDALRVELKRSYDLIEQNHLSVVEHALMHDVSVEDSLNAAEAAEHIESLRQKLEALQQSRDFALAEMKSARVDSGDVQERLSVTEREKQLLEAHVKHLTDALHSSFSRETALHKRTIDLNGRLEALVATATLPDEDNNRGEDGDGVARPPPPSIERLEQMASRVAEQLASCERLLAERTEAGKSEAASAVAHTIKDLEENLARCGLHKVSTLLYDALFGSALLQKAVDTSVLQQRGQLAKAAVSADDLTPELKTAELELQNRRLSDELALLKQHRQEYEQRLERATEAITKSEAQTKRLLDVSNLLMEQKNKLSQKVASLQAEMEELRQRARPPTPPPLPPALPDASPERASEELPPAQPVAPVLEGDKGARQPDALVVAEPMEVDGARPMTAPHAVEPGATVPRPPMAPADQLPDEERALEDDQPE